MAVELRVLSKVKARGMLFEAAGSVLVKGKGNEEDGNFQASLLLLS